MSGTTGNTGGGQPFNNLQPSLVITEVTSPSGIFPSQGNGGALGDTLGFIYDFAGNFPPGDSFSLQGQTLSPPVYQILFALFGTAYGGDGTTTFSLPNLQGTAIVGAGTGPGLPTQVLGVATGSTTITLSNSQIPAHDHTLPGGGVTGDTGGGLPFNNMQPSLPVETLIAVSGVFPSNGGGSGSSAFIGQIANFAGNFAPAGWMQAAGQVISIAQNTALFSILGTTYGGDGKTTFALPDLRGRVAVGADAADPLGTAFGQASTTLTVAQLPPHDHTLPGGGVTGTTGGGQPVTDDQPSLAVNYLIATNGIFPPRDGGNGLNLDTPTVGQIVEFAGNFAPSGWAFANGQVMSIAQNTALFSILGTQYGGDGKTTFALPDLRGRTTLGAGTLNGTSYFVGEQIGSDATTLTVANLPAHDHTVPCFVAGTYIATERGEVTVEALREGDRVRVLGGADETIVWIGRRFVDCRRHPRPERVRPVRIAAGAFGGGLPYRDLWLSPDHAIYENGVLVPVKYLLDGDLIEQVPVDAVTYFHVGLAKHSVLSANGLPSESLLPRGDLGVFENAACPVQLHPDFSSAAWEAQGCAPLVVAGPVLDAIRLRLHRARRPVPASRGRAIG